jgi:hypothetical protein
VGVNIMIGKLSCSVPHGRPVSYARGVMENAEPVFHLEAPHAAPNAAARGELLGGRSCS